MHRAILETERSHKRSIRTKRVQANKRAAAKAAALFVNRDDQIVGFQADGINRYFAPSFSTWPIEGKAKWKPTTVAFSAAAMS
jgi:hypothetical protein